MPTAMKTHSTDPSHDIAENKDFVLPLEDREQHDSGAEVGDDEEQLQ